MSTVVIVLALLSSFPEEDAATLLAKAAAAYSANQKKEKHWNWTSLEKRRTLDGKGAVVQEFPSVEIEKVIRGRGRCNAVLAWGDGVTPYLLNADAESRCQVEADSHDLLNIPLLLGNAHQIERSTPEFITLRLPTDNSREVSNDAYKRCAGSIETTVDVDAVTYFPRKIHGEVTGTGCNQDNLQRLSYYGEDWPAGHLTSSFRQGTSFQLDYALQQDKFQNPENNFWIAVHERFESKWNSPNASGWVYWGRRIKVHSAIKAKSFVKETETKAQEFGTESQVKFDPK